MCFAYQPCATAAMTDDTLLPFDLPAVRRKKLTVDFAGGNQSSDAGLLLLREAERKLGVCRRLADAMPDGRDQSRVRHQMFELVMARSSGIACGHKDGNDHDRLRYDPLMKLAVGRCPETGAPLASQSTYSRLENAPRKVEAARLGGALVDQFCVAVKPGRQEVIDIDDTFCAARHGGAMLRMDAASSWPFGTRIRTSAASPPCTSITSEAARRSPRSCAPPARRRGRRCAPSSSTSPDA